MSSRSALVLLLAAASTGAAARRPPVSSWGKPGVSRDDNRKDAIACALPAARRDVAGEEETTRYVQGFEALERENNMPPLPVPAGEDPTRVRAERQVLLRRMYQPDRQVDKLQARLQGEVDACLSSRGYHRFVLSREQAGRLRALPVGSEARRAFLHGLASDPEVLKSQRAPEDPSRDQ